MDEVKSDEEEKEVVLMGRVSGLVEADKQDGRTGTEQYS